MKNEELKKKIDGMSYSDMLSAVRFKPSGQEMFMGEAGDYFFKVMGNKAKSLTPRERNTISKSVGW